MCVSHAGEAQEQLQAAVDLMPVRRRRPPATTLQIDSAAAVSVSVSVSVLMHVSETIISSFFY
jgi:hypothetical protein